MGKLNVLQYLTRRDKYYLGGGNRLLWAPRFPLWLDHPGFWDGAHYYNMEIAPVFAVTLLDERGIEILLVARSREWQPARLIQRYGTSVKIAVTERKALLEGDCLISELSLRNNAREAKKIHLVLWTVQESFPSQEQATVTDISCRDGILSFIKGIGYRNLPLYHVGCALGADREMSSYGIYLSEGSVSAPRWQVTPFSERFAEGTLGNEERIPDENEGGLVFMGIHVEIDVASGGREDVMCAFSAAPTVQEAISNLGKTNGGDSPIRRSVRSWSRYFGDVPYFECSDLYIQKYYWYRWYGLRLFTLKGEEGNYTHPCICEGPHYFRVPISYSAQCHILESKWMREPAIGQGSLLNFVSNQKEDGSYVGHIYPHGLHLESFYHANWAFIWDLCLNHPDDDFLKRAYESLKRYVTYCDRERDTEGTGLYDIFNHYETGQEYMHRYVAVDKDADRTNWGRVFRLKGVDATTYLYEIKMMLARVAERFGDEAVGVFWREGAERIKMAVREKMWDPGEEMFFDIDPSTWQRTRVKAATCFYPYFTDMVTREHLPGLKRHLFNAAEFWPPYPVPSSSLDDPYFSAWGEWKGKRMNCPWNGRVWPMANSHTAEAIARAAIRFDDAELRERAVEFIGTFIRMMFFDGDPERPNCFEHYHPFSGRPSLYRGVDDYQHSWVVDLIVKYVCGLRVEESRVVVDPFPFPIDSFSIERVTVRGAKIGVTRRDDRFSVSVNGTLTARSRIGEAVEINV